MAKIKQKKQLDEMTSGGTGSGAIATAPIAMGKKKVIKREDASPMIKPPANRFDTKAEAFAYAKENGGKVFKSTYNNPRTGEQIIKYYVKKDQTSESLNDVSPLMSIDRREPLITKLEKLPQGDEAFETARFWAIEELKKGNMLKARYWLYKLKKNKPTLSESKSSKKKETLTEGKLANFLPPFSSNGGLWVNDSRGDSVLEVTSHGLLSTEVAKALNQYVGIKEEMHHGGKANVILKLDPTNPMDDTMVAVLGGAGSYSLKGLRDKARREVAEMVKRLESDHPVAFRDSAYNVRQLANTLNTIATAYDELKAIRAKGGKKSRGIAVSEEKQKGVDGKACWDGYKRMGTKKKGDKTVDNCVPMKKK